jgi:hypothetical protein
LENLTFASFENNKIADFSNIERLAAIESLKEINFNNNQITKTIYYRSNVIKKFLSLVKLDGLEVTKEERELAMMELQNTCENIDTIGMCGLDVDCLMGYNHNVSSPTGIGSLNNLMGNLTNLNLINNLHNLNLINNK